ncbi:rhodanese-like domain-containing protein [Rhodobaculum claviforme]|uniref:Rhodanese domain-containing protein n=1 Tax=Rhodobaculum claviforme TaxID=1549854 RepID=A0A934TI45_9RHOB|nr:rhodanese-like domain-containing protein [Rhodobaculum claviforme]MBK5926124.1 hypothetical protein [Rhodobaculum claviforme]
MLRRPAALLLAALMGIALPALAEGPYLSAPSVAQLAAADVLLVDIRTPGEWRRDGVLPQALLVEYTGDDARFLADLAPHLDGRPVALVCRSGNRTAQAAAALAPALEVPVIDLAGGMNRLRAAGVQVSAPTRAQGCASC